MHHNLSISPRNMKKMKISQTQQKRDTPEMHIITGVFEENTMLTLNDKKGTLQECL